jgi:hypothetical protein
LFWVLFSQLPPASEIGTWREDSTVPSRIASLRAQISVSAQLERVLMFDALLADAHVSKSGSLDQNPNPYLPFLTPPPQDWSPVLMSLNELNPQLPVDRLDDQLRALPLTDAEETDLLHDGMLPESFFKALEDSRDEWAHDRAIDGLLHARVYDERTDALARTLAERLLNARLGRNMQIIEGLDAHDPRADQTDNGVVLVSYGKGFYGRGDGDAVSGRVAGTDTDSFYLAIISQLQADERHSLGLKSDDDVTGLRRAIAKLAIDDNGGWFPFEGIARPAWFDQASPADRIAWENAAHAHIQALVEALAPGLADVAAYGGPEQLRIYARARLSERLKNDHGLELEPDDVTVEIVTFNAQGFAVEGSEAGVQITSETERCSLTDLSLRNFGFLHRLSKTTTTALNDQGEQIHALTGDYLYGLVRDLDVGENYAKYLTEHLLTSAEGEWRKERYVQIVQAQMRVHALEAKLSGQLERGRLRPGQEDRAYNWIIAALDNPLDGIERAEVDGHQISVQRMKIDGVTLDGLLLIAPVSREAVPSLVVYIPQAPDKKYFRLFNDGVELRQEIFRNPLFLDYLVSRAPAPWQEQVRASLTVHGRNFMLESVPLARNFYEAAYDDRVAHALASVNEQTNTTWEKNWQDTWDIVVFVGEVALMFAPFYIAVPVLSLQVIHAIIRGVVGTIKGERESALYFNEAAVLLLGLFLGAGRRQPAATGGRNSLFSPKAALKKVPDGMQLRTDGNFNGVYQTTLNGSPSAFYVKVDGRTYPIRYDQGFSTWKLVDPRRHDAYYQVPITFKDGEWVHAKLGLLGSGRKAQRRETPGTSNAAAAAGSVDKGPTRYTLEMNGLEQDKIFKKVDGYIQDKLKKSIAEVVEDYERRGGGKFHGYTPKGASEKIYTLDLTGMPNSTGRGAWRLQLKEKLVQKMEEGEPVFKVNKKTGEREPVMEVEKGVLVFDKILSTH